MDIQNIISTLSSQKKLERGVYCIEGSHLEKKAEGILFFKPEICSLSSGSLEKIFNYFCTQCRVYKIQPLSTHILTGKFLRTHRIFDKVYEKACQYASLGYTKKEDSELAFAPIQNSLPDWKYIVGSTSIVQEGATPSQVHHLWNSGLTVKLKDDMYGSVCRYKGEATLLINGFIPTQKTVFEAPENKLVLITFRTDSPFPKLKSEFQGAPDSIRRHPHSLRSFFERHKRNLGFECFSASQNGIHMSGSTEEGKSEIQAFKDALTFHFQKQETS